MHHNIRDVIIQKLKSRTFIVGLIFVLLFSLVAGRVFYLQIVRGEDYLSGFKMKIQKTQEVKSTRGNIYDRNGKLLAYDELAYSVTIEDTGAFDSLSNNKKNDALNNTILDVFSILDQNGDTIASYFNITLDDSGNYEFTDDEGSSRNRFIADVYGAKSFDDLTKKQQNATADDIMNYVCSDDRYHINIDKVGKNDALRIVNIRYAMTQINYTKYLVTTIAKDVSDETVSMIKENSSKLEGISITEESLRRYPDAKYFASVIGYTGVISTEEYEEYSKESDSYSLNDIVGKAGIEQIMDQKLQGRKGEKTFYVDSMGNILKTASETEPTAGNDLYLTIDHDLQVAAYNLLEQKLAGIVYSKIIPALTYDPHTADKTTNIAIPIGDVYINMFENLVLDVSAFPDAADGTVQKQVYQTFTGKQESVLSFVTSEIQNATGTATGLGEEKEAYLRYVVDDILEAKGILNSDKIDTADATYEAWEKEGSISLKDYLEYAISQDWIDTAVLNEKTGSESKYSDSAEILSDIAAYIGSILPDDISFTRTIYHYMVLEGSVSGAQVCMMLYEQGVLAEDQASYAALASGSMSPYDFIRSKIQSLELTPSQIAVEPCTASCVITDPNNGDVLACVSYPGYDNNRLSNTMDSAYYNKLLKDKSQPLYNHATQERTAPGSTFKMVSAMAGLDSGILTGDTTIQCTGIFEKITPSPKCWIYSGAHGYLGVSEAIMRSCNCFFFEVGYELGLDEENNYSSDRGTEALAKYAAEFGLDSTSGIEIPEVKPQISDSDSVRSAIGQGTNNYTTSQLARYVSAIANEGTVYNLTLLDKLTDTKGNVIEDYQTDVYNEIQTSQMNWNLIRNGMEAMVSSASQFTTLSRMDFSMAGKTGTAQQSEVHPDHCLFVGYAPSETPQIAFAIRIANGYTSAYTCEIASNLVQYYFNLTDESALLNGTASDVGENTIED